MKTSDKTLLERAIELTQKQIDSITNPARDGSVLAKNIVTEDFLRRFRELFNDIDRSQAEL